MNGSAGELGVVVAAGTLPFAVFALLAGVWADRLARQKVMLASDLIRFVVQLTAGLLLLTRNAELWHLALAAVYGTAMRPSSRRSAGSCLRSSPLPACRRPTPCAR